jgi:hypothetical protein
VVTSHRTSAFCLLTTVVTCSRTGYSEGVSGKGTPRSVRLSDEAARTIQWYADRDGVSWNEAARRLLKWAIVGCEKTMPKGWH